MPRARFSETRLRKPKPRGKGARIRAAKREEFAWGPRSWDRWRASETEDSSPDPDFCALVRDVKRAGRRFARREGNVALTPEPEPRRTRFFPLASRPLDWYERWRFEDRPRVVGLEVTSFGSVTGEVYRTCEAVPIFRRERGSKSAPIEGQTVERPNRPPRFSREKYLLDAMKTLVELAPDDWGHLRDFVERSERRLNRRAAYALARLRGKREALGLTDEEDDLPAESFET